MRLPPQYRRVNAPSVRFPQLFNRGGDVSHIDYFCLGHVISNPVISAAIDARTFRAYRPSAAWSSPRLSKRLRGFLGVVEMSVTYANFALSIGLSPLLIYRFRVAV